MKTLPVDIKISIILAILLMVMIVMFLIFIIVLYYRRQMVFDREKRLKDMEYQTRLLQKEVDFQKRTRKEQERISHDLHDDLGAGLSALKLQTEFLKRKTTDESISQNIEELLEICDELNISMRQMLWNLKVGNDSLANFTQRIINYTRGFFAKSSIKVHITKNEMGLHEILSETRRNIFMCVKESLNNIYKHSKSENVRISFNLTGKIFTIDIIDDGIGMSENVTAGNGLANMRSRMESVCGGFNFIPSDKGLHIHLRINLDKKIPQEAEV